MKIRQGFVSNSSSSSFVVAFPKKPQTVEDVKQMMFRDDSANKFRYYDYECLTSQVVEQILKDIKKATIKNMVESLSHGWFNGRIDGWDKAEHLSYNIPAEREERDKIYKECDEENERIAKSIIKKFRDDNKGCFFAVFDYADGDGEFFCIMEHGGIFENLEHIQTSYH